MNRRTSEYQQNDAVNDTVKTLKKSLQKIYTAILNNPEITHSEIMEMFHISESTAKRATGELKRLGIIKREGSDKTGRWVVLNQIRES